MDHDLDITPLYAQISQHKRDRDLLLSFVRAVMQDDLDRVSPGVKAAARETLRLVGEG
jgi:hypothetical protein